MHVIISFLVTASFLNNAMLTFKANSHIFLLRKIVDAVFPLPPFLPFELRWAGAELPPPPPPPPPLPSPSAASATLITYDGRRRRLNQAE